MIPFFKKKNPADAIHGKERVVDASELTGAQTKVGTVSVATKLAFSKGAAVEPEDRYYFQFLLNELPPLKRNQISLAPIELRKVGGRVLAQFFIRQTLESPIALGETALVLTDGDGRAIGFKTVDLTPAGDIPAESGMPWIAEFLESELEVPFEEVPTEEWGIGFELQTEHRLDLADEWETSLADPAKEQLRQLVGELEPPGKNELNFMGLQAAFQPDGNFAVAVLVRNGHRKDVSLERLPLQVLDAAQRVVAEGSFTLPPLSVKANTSKPWTFLFPPAMIQLAEPDLSSWTARVPSGANVETKHAD